MEKIDLRSVAVSQGCEGRSGWTAPSDTSDMHAALPWSYIPGAISVNRE